MQRYSADTSEQQVNLIIDSEYKDVVLKRVERDFICLFNCLWYQDFPVIEGEYINRSNWTIHVGLVMRECAKLMGARAFFEQGGRTDAVLRYPDTQILSYVEWEYIQADRQSVNELDKLLEKNNECYFSTFISYCQPKNLRAVLDKASQKWCNASNPLIFFLITYEPQPKKGRHFLELRTYVFSKGKHKQIRKQPALPWNIEQRKYNVAEDEDNA